MFTGVAWVLLLLGLWLWGRDVTDLPDALSSPTTGDAAAVGRPLGLRLPPAHEPVAGSRPEHVDVPALGVRAPVEPRGLDGEGAIDPPSYEAPDTVGWYGGGVRPGAVGAALLVGHVDTDTGQAVFYHLSSTRAGDTIRVSRQDGTVAEFTVDDVEVFSRDRFDAAKAYGQHQRNRAELRLITCGGDFDSASRVYSANVVVSAYLTSVEGH
ncbi:class F sortase [Streptomyces tsukubensis]|uniref:Class F sortase n=1 Tax=Streptomyces tsukubensis TaxID=83656 RepID=A0A1V4A744_9ACTN|nr:class F sortase [Streptomyces tsukubensis]